MHLRTRTQYIQILSQSLASHGIIWPLHYVIATIAPLGLHRKITLPFHSGWLDTLARRSAWAASER